MAYPAKDAGRRILSGGGTCEHVPYVRTTNTGRFLTTMHLPFSLALLALAALPAAAQTPDIVSPTRAELALRLLSPVERSARDDAPAGTREAPSFGALWAAGVGGGVAGGLMLGGVGRIIEGPPAGGETLYFLTPVGAYVGSSMIGAPLGVHIANGRRGRLWAGIMTSVAGDVATLLVAGAAQQRYRTAVTAVGTAGKVAAVVAVERASERW